MKSRPRASSSLARALLALGLAAVAHVAHAQLEVTGINYGTSVNGSNNSVGGITFSNVSTPVNSVNTTNGLYLFNGPVATSITFRRGSTGANNATVFYQYDSRDRAYGSYDANLSEVFLGSSLYSGIRNPFANVDSSSSAAASGIERIDFYLPNYTVSAGDALVFFDLENTGNFGDGFRIAAFTGYDTATNAPTVYANTGTLIAPDSFGPGVSSPSDGTNGAFEYATYTNGNNLTGTPSVTDLGTGYNLVGIVIRFSDLGIPAGTVIQGFSLMAGDVAVTNANSLVNWNNTSVYRNDTNADSWGNMDFMGFGAQIARPIPEPESYGLLVAGAGLGFLAWRRRRAATRAEARA